MYLAFSDFRAPFVTIFRKKLCIAMQEIGVPSKMISLVKTITKAAMEVVRLNVAYANHFRMDKE